MYGEFIPTSKEELYQYISDEQVYFHYFKEFELNKWYKSPFPFRKDTNPSFIITYYNKELLWRDFGISPNPSDCVSFVATLYSINYFEAIKLIYNTIINSIENTRFPTLKRAYKEKVSIKPILKYSPLKPNEMSYWEAGELTPNEINFYKIYKGEVWYDDKRVLFSHGENTAFVYLFDIQKKIWKAYNPLHKSGNLKFFSNNINNHIQNYDNLGITGSDILFITKSYKDCIVLNKCGYDAIAPHCETIVLAPWDVDYLKTKYSHIYVFYDNDETGINKSIAFTEMHKLKYINVPTSLNKPNKKIKDPWDVVTEYDYNLLHDIIIDKFIRDAL